MDYLKTLIIRFKNEIKFYEVPALRGGILSSIGENKNILFHNHSDDGFRYSYPLIQYKRINGKAAMICIKDGIETIGEFFASNDTTINISGREISLEIESIIPERLLIQTWDKSFSYCIRKWLPLNSENFQKYMQIESLKDKILFLEGILRGNLLSFAKGVDIHIESQIICEILQISEPFIVKNKGVKLMSFDIEFKTNLSIPNFIGIGKNASLGYGIITKIKTN